MQPPDSSDPPGNRAEDRPPADPSHHTRDSPNGTQVRAAPYPRSATSDAGSSAKAPTDFHNPRPDGAAPPAGKCDTDVPDVSYKLLRGNSQGPDFHPGIRRILPPGIPGCFNILFQAPFKASSSQKRPAHRPISPLCAFMDQTPKRAEIGRAHVWTPVTRSSRMP